MTIHSLTLTNPGAEDGTSNGWTTRSGGGPSASTSASNGGPHTGSWKFIASTNTATAKWDQTIDLTSYASAIDAGTAGCKGTVYHTSFASDGDKGGLYLEFYAVDGTTLLGSIYNSQTNIDSWTQDTIELGVPAGARSVRIGTENTRVAGTELSVYWDDFTLEISDDVSTDYGWSRITNAYQLGTYVLANYESEGAQANQIGVNVLGSAETSNTVFKFYGHQIGVYVLCRGRLDPRKLRAWTFPQDDHIFYVLQLGDETLVFDSWTGQWAQWKSPGFNFWRGADGLAWQGFNVCCDTESGIIWKIDDEGRKDNGDTPIESKVIGGLSERFRTFVPCFMAELAVSEGSPPAGIDASTLSITLRTSSDAGSTWTNHGSVPGEAIGDDITVRWYGLGLMKAPGQLFEITDTGYARRIDGLDIKVSDDGSPQ